MDMGSIGVKAFAAGEELIVGRSTVFHKVMDLHENSCPGLLRSFDHPGKRSIESEGRIVDDPEIRIDCQELINRYRSCVAVVEFGNEMAFAIPILHRATGSNDDPVSHVLQDLDLGLNHPGHSSGAQMIVNNQDGHFEGRGSLHDSVAMANGIRYRPAMKNSGWWQMSLAIAAVTLADRVKRRKFITGLLLFILAYFSLGNWPMNSWLSQGLWRMLIFWGFLGVLCLLLILFALFDALAAIGEEKRKLGVANPLEDEESSLD